MLQVWTAEKPHPQEEVGGAWMICTAFLYSKISLKIVIRNDIISSLSHSQAVFFLFQSYLSFSTWTVFGPKFRSLKKTAGRSATSYARILLLIACCARLCSTTCPPSPLRDTCLIRSTPCPELCSACSTTLMPQRYVVVV